MTPAQEALAALVQSQSGQTVGADKLYLLETRLAPVLKRHGLASFDALANRLRGAPASGPTAELAREVVEAMTTNETLFFRDGKPFAHLRERGLRQLHEARPTGQPLRFWSAAASTGQEAYSLAMTALESVGTLGTRPVRIVGTDIAREPLARAREGTYTQFEVQRGMPMGMLVKYCSKEGLCWRVTQQARALVEFREWNLLSDPAPLGRFDVIFCRNVLIYFDLSTKTRVLDGLARVLAPDGLLYLGGAETTLGVTTQFVPMPGERGVYTRAGSGAVQRAA